MEKGCDPTNLARWTWTRYRGKNNQTLWVTTAYRPNHPNGPFAVYAQHNAYIHARDNPRCPGKAFLKNLCEDIKIFLESDDNIMLMLDGNSDMRRGDLKDALESCSLKEIILEKHRLQDPETFKRNNTKTPIDRIQASPTIVKSCVYFSYNAVFINTDHHCLWGNISYVNAFGHNKPIMIKPSTLRLHCKDPRIISNYIALYKEYINKNKLLSRLNKLQNCSGYQAKRFTRIWTCPDAKDFALLKENAES